MPFVQRDAGRIVGLFANLQPEIAEEYLAEDAPELLAFTDAQWRNAVWLDYRTRREVYLDRLSGIATFDDEGDGIVRAACKSFRQRLLDLPADQSVSVASTPTRDQLEAAIFALYVAARNEAIAAAPAAKVAFDRIAK